MAKIFVNGKWKKRILTALSLALSLTVATGIFAACGGTSDEDEEDEDDTTVSETDNQLLKNGNFEFFTEMSTDLDDRRALIYSPASWSITTGSPTSDTASGIINTSQTEWDFLTASKYRLVNFDTENTDSENKTQAKANEAVDFAVAHWSEASAYDRLEFLSEYDAYFTDYKISTLDKTSEAGKLFADYSYSIDFEDVEKLRSELGETVKTHYADDDEDAENNVLMIHNSRVDSLVAGTAQYYTSSTTITLSAGTAAELSVWVKTSNLTHYNDADNVAVTSNAGAYIGVTHTVGGTTLDQMQIKNINTELYQDDANNGWQQYTLYIRANTFATSTFKIVLGLGMGDTSNRFEQVNGYALFDDLTCKIIKDSEYTEKTQNLNEAVTCGLGSLKDDKIFDATKLAPTGLDNVYALDLHAGFTTLSLNGNDSNTVVSEPELTTETSGSKEYQSLIPDNRNDGTESNKQSIAGLYSYNELKDMAANNGYLVNIFRDDFQEDLFPFENSSTLNDKNVVMLLSTNGAAYTAKITSDKFELESNSRMLVSFFVKTSSIRNGKTGATAILVDGDTEYPIAAFDSTTVATVDVNDDLTDIYNGWVQCFFFVDNPTTETRSFSLKLCYGPTSVADSAESDYCDGYAAFANFEIMENMTKTMFSYASSGTYTQTVSLSGKVASAAKFDDAAITPPDIKIAPAKPANFTGVQSGNIQFVPGGNNNPSLSELNETGLYTGLLNSEYTEAYMNAYSTDSSALWSKMLNNIANGATDGSNSLNADDWWGAVFGDASINGMAATQPLAIMNTANQELPAYGYLSRTATIAASTYQKISMRVKVSEGATANIYLIDTSDIKAGYNNMLSPTVPNVTYWYDDEGNICSKDPSSDDFNARTDIAYYLDEDNGLYTEAGKTDGIYYANFANYKTDEDGNLTTKDGTTAYYYKDGKYYGDYDKSTNTYSLEVKALPATGDIVRYTAPSAEEMEKYGSCITVTGTDGKWVEVSFYVHTGSVEKNYRLEVWAGARNDYTVDEDGNLETVGAGKGLPAGGYVFFDNYSSESISDYDSVLAEYVAATKDLLNAGKSVMDEGYLTEDDNLPAEYALYYTFTFYDSPNYLRYDVSKDEVDDDGDPLGNPYGSYKQSAYEEQLVWFAYSDDGALTGAPVTARFLDYSAADVDVPQDSLGSTGSDSSTSTDDTSTTNIWLVISSGILAFALLFAIVAIIVRRTVKKVRKNSAGKPPKQKKEKAAPKLRVVPDEEPEAEEKTPEDDNGPYSE